MACSTILSTDTTACPMSTLAKLNLSKRGFAKDFCVLTISRRLKFKGWTTSISNYFCSRCCGELVFPLIRFSNTLYLDHMKNAFGQCSPERIPGGQNNTGVSSSLCCFVARSLGIFSWNRCRHASMTTSVIDLSFRDSYLSISFPATLCAWVCGPVFFNRKDR